ncbi:MAG: hypothetical protein KME64_09445 [Scytonematopsis contorta HA4267-MV1]|nr:hypothetical protein [Scytonematopsis contorta HA4267-MV1]
MSNWTNPYYESTSSEEQQIYQHLLKLLESQSPSQMIERFRALFIEGADYPETEILLLLDKIVVSNNSEQDFKYFLNRCCHILINRWHMQPQLYSHVPGLIAVFEKQPSRSRIHSFRYAAIRRLQEQVKQFTQSEQYQALCRLARVMSHNRVMSNNKDFIPHNQNQPLITLIPRYPYLYQHCLLSDNCAFEHKNTVRTIQEQVQKQFEIDLSKYVTYQIRRAEIIKVSSVEQADRILRGVNNPTLLQNAELYTTLRQFIGKVESGSTYQDLAKSFLQYSRQSPDFYSFKEDLYQYLIPTIDSDYGKRKFYSRLHNQLHNILPEANSQKINEFLLVRTCSQILNFLVVESSALPQHFTFIDLVNNQGTTVTTALLLKIALICQKIKPYLEKRLAILFNHYEASATSCIQWLVTLLEQVNIALSIHFGDIDLSYFKKCC